MRLQFIIILVFATVSNFCSGQSYSFYQVPQTLPFRYRFDIQKEKEAIIAKSYPGAKQHEVIRFAEHNLYAKQSMLSNGSIIMDQDIEEYLTGILRKLLPDSLKSLQIKAYLTNDVSFNAFSIFDGTVFINIGCVASINHESGLAFMLAHELTHSIYRDAEALYYKEVKIDRISDDNTEKKRDGALANAAYNRNQERRADSLAFVLTKRAGYDVQHGVADFSNLLMLEEKYNAWIYKQKALSQAGKDGKTSYERESSKFSTHPETAARVETLQEKLKAQTASASKWNDSDMFRKLQQLSVYERMKGFLKEYDFQNCMESAFDMYLKSPTNQLAVYYLLEALRQDMYHDTLQASKTFIVSQYTDMDYDKSILLQLDKFYRDSAYANQLAQTHAIPLETPFKTEREVFHYFAQLAEENHYTECYLSLALYYAPTDKLLRDKYLNLYLANKNVQYYDYAQALLHDKLRNTDNGQEMIVVSDILMLENHHYGSFYNFTKSQQLSRSLFEQMAGFIKRYSSIPFVSLSGVKSQNFRQYCDYKDVFEAILFNTSIKTEKPQASDVIYFGNNDSNGKNFEFDFLLMRPDFWTLLHKYNISKVQYISEMYYVNKDIFREYFSTMNPINLLFGVLYMPIKFMELNYSRHQLHTERYSYSLTQTKQPEIDKRLYYNNLDKASYNNAIYQYVTEK